MAITGTGQNMEVRGVPGPNAPPLGQLGFIPVTNGITLKLCFLGILSAEALAFWKVTPRVEQ